jgi:hypothetical protein
MSGLESRGVLVTVILTPLGAKGVQEFAPPDQRIPSLEWTLLIG